MRLAKDALSQCQGSTVMAFGSGEIAPVFVKIRQAVQGAVYIGMLRPQHGTPDLQ